MTDTTPRFTADDKTRARDWMMKSFPNSRIFENRVMSLANQFSEVRQQAAVDLQSAPTREEGAKIIYDAFPFDGVGAKEKPAWVPGGNSLMQDLARATFDKLTTAGVRVRQ